MEAIINFDNIYHIKDETDIGTVKVIMLKGERGEAGYSGDYAQLANRPQINSVTLAGNKTANDLGLLSTADGTALQNGIDAVNDDVSTLSGEVTQNTSDIGDLATAVRNHGTRIEVIETNVGLLEDGIDALETQINARATSAFFTPTSIQPSVNSVAGATINYYHVIKSGYVVDLTLYLSTTSNFSPAVTLMTGLPQPMYDVYETMGNWAATYKRPLLCRITTNGELTIEHGEADTNYRIHICYIMGG